VADYVCEEICYFDHQLWHKGEVLDGVTEEHMSIIPKYFRRTDTPKPKVEVKVESKQEGGEVVKRKRGRPPKRRV